MSEIYYSDPNYWTQTTMVQIGVWRTADGQLLQIRHMSTKHLINTITMIWRIEAKHSRGIKLFRGSRYYDPKTKIHEMLNELARRDKP